MSANTPPYNPDRHSERPSPDTSAPAPSRKRRRDKKACKPSVTMISHPDALDHLARMQMSDDGCPNDGLRWWQRCTDSHDCVCPDHLLACLNRFIGSVPEYLNRNGVEEDAAVEAMSLIYLKAREWANDGTAAAMTPDHRRGLLFLSALNLSKDIKRKRRRGPLGKAIPLTAEQKPRARPSDPGPFQAEEDARVAGIKDGELALFRECLAELSGEERRLIDLRYCGEKLMSMPRVARLMSYNCASTARRRVNAAVRRLISIFLSR